MGLQAGLWPRGIRRLSGGLDQSLSHGECEIRHYEEKCRVSPEISPGRLLAAESLRQPASPCCFVKAWHVTVSRGPVRH